jgi:hypothetical protein
MPPKQYMLKHKGFPSRYPGTDFQFTIRRANPKGTTPLKRLERFRDRKALDKSVDEAFMAALWHHFGEEPFERCYLDAGRLSGLLGREVVSASEPFDPTSYEQLLQIDLSKAKISFPKVLEDPESYFEDDDDWEDDDWD